MCCFGSFIGGILAGVILTLIANSIIKKRNDKRRKARIAKD